MNTHKHEHAFPNLAHDLLVDGHARALDPLEHEAHSSCVGCQEQWQQSCARQLELSVQEFVNYSDAVASTASTRAVLAVAPFCSMPKWHCLQPLSQGLSLSAQDHASYTPLRSLKHALEARATSLRAGSP